jgi:hypothetical protein
MSEEQLEQELEVYTLLNPQFGWPMDDCWHDKHREELAGRY